MLYSQIVVVCSKELIEKTNAKCGKNSTCDQFLVNQKSTRHKVSQYSLVNFKLNSCSSKRFCLPTARRAKQHEPECVLTKKQREYWRFEVTYFINSSEVTRFINGLEIEYFFIV